MRSREERLNSSELEYAREQDRKHKASQRQRRREGTQTTTEALTTGPAAGSAPVYNFHAGVGGVLTGVGGVLTGGAFGNIKKNEMYGPAPGVEEKRIEMLEAKVAAFQAEAPTAEKLKRENMQLKKQVEQLLTSSRLDTTEAEKVRTFPRAAPALVALVALVLVLLPYSSKDERNG
jgi:hypothetical protein